jgi:exoribonuclease R
MTTKQVGVLELASKYRYGLTTRGAPLYLFKPYNQDQPDLIVGSSERDLTRNQIALVECPLLTGTNEKGRGNLIRLFGPVGDPTAERAALLEHYCPNKSVRAEVLVPDTADDENRRPIDEKTGWVTFHIDPPGCRDIDDAIAYHHDTKTWAITIADVASAISDETLTDCAAEAIGSTFYTLEGQAIKPMLPPIISEEAASLLPGQRRRGLTLFLDPDGSEHFALTWITVAHSFTYDSFVGSAVAFDLQVSKEPHAWIEELMIRYNRAAARMLKQAGAGILRTQPAADAEKIAAWAAIDPMLANEAALYETASLDPKKDQTHASLGLYCHASSPLRRYADLVNQRLLKTILKGQQPLTDPAMAARLNDRAKANKRWSRDLTFLTHVTPGRVHEIDVVWASGPADQKQRVWVPLWKRLIRLRHEERHPVGTKGRIQIFCDPTKRNWKQRVLTAPVVIGGP